MGIKFHDFRDDRQTFDRGEWQATIDMNKWLEDKNIDGQYSMNFDGTDLTGFNEKGAT